MRDDAIGDVDGEVVSRIASTSLRHENEVPRPIIGRMGLRGRGQGKAAHDRRGKQQVLHWTEALSSRLLRSHILAVQFKNRELNRGCPLSTQYLLICRSTLPSFEDRDTRHRPSRV
jgi:hypothetical protein